MSKDIIHKYQRFSYSLKSSYSTAYKQGLSIFNRKLRDHSNGSKYRRVLVSEVISMTEDLLQAPPLLEALVDCLVSDLWAFVGDWSLHKVRKLTKVISISFHSFTFYQMVF